MDCSSDCIEHKGLLLKMTGIDYIMTGSTKSVCNHIQNISYMYIMVDLADDQVVFCLQTSRRMLFFPI